MFSGRFYRERLKFFWPGSQNFVKNFNLTRLFWPLIYYIFWKIPTIIYFDPLLRLFST